MQLNPTILICIYSSAKVHAVAMATKAKLLRYFWGKEMWDSTLRGRREGEGERASLEQRRRREYSHLSGRWWKLTKKLISVISGCLTICSINICTYINHCSADTSQVDVSDRLPFIFIWLGDLLLTFCPENATRENLMQCPDSVGFILWGAWMRCVNIPSE